MPKTDAHAAEHEITVGAPAADIYDVIAEVRHWPRIYPPTIYADRIETGEREERIRIWATANGEAKTWTSRRTLDPERRRITFRQEVSSPPVAFMAGTWIVEQLSQSESRIRLLHEFRAVDGDADGLKWISEAVDRNSRSELAGLKRTLERAQLAGEDHFSFEDTVRIAGSAEDVYGFVNDAHLWAQRLPHVEEAKLSEDTPGLQRLQMVTRAPNGSTHATESFRVCFPHHRIAYKQIAMPALMTVHAGCWSFEPDGAGTVATSQHTVVLNTENITAILGPDATAADARKHVQEALSGNSRTTLEHAKRYAEQRS